MQPLRFVFNLTKTSKQISTGIHPRQPELLLHWAHVESIRSRYACAVALLRERKIHGRFMYESTESKGPRRKSCPAGQVKEGLVG
jgi:hypothetical protein